MKKKVVTKKVSSKSMMGPAMSKAMSKKKPAMMKTKKSVAKRTKMYA